MSRPATLDSNAFATKWNALDRSERLRLRRTVRMGRKVDPPEMQPLAVEYARFQVERPWIRLFWLWFLPGIFVLLAVSAQIHPILVGVTVALGAQAVWAWINLRKAARRAP